MTIDRAISNTVYTQWVTTASILAKLAVCAILLASVTCAQAVSGDESNQSGVSRRAGVHAAPKLTAAKPRPIRNVADSNLAKLEREWKRQRSRRQVALLRSLVVRGDDADREWTLGGFPSVNP
jgi:hypothetical protein